MPRIEYGKWIISTEAVSCSCPDFQYRRRNIPKTSPERLCKHLKQAYEEGRFNISAPTQTKTAKKRLPRLIAQYIVIDLAYWLKKEGVKKWEFCGSYRRNKPNIGDLDLLVMQVDGDENEKLERVFAKCAQQVIEKGPQKARYVVNQCQVDTRIVTPEAWPFALMHFTGSVDENVRLRSIARQYGLILNEYGLTRQIDSAKISLASEEEIYHYLNQTYKKPEER